jgi:class 3 adenylate cyclase
MRCGGCGHENREAAKFCDECGAPLASPSAPPSAPPPPIASERADPRSYTPKHLAERILHEHAALAGEHKQVTVLFVDIAGSMELADRVGAEAWHQLLDRFFLIMNESVHRLEGTVNQYTGDGIMALFGAPLAHEDHAERACHAALAARDRLREFAAELAKQRGITFAVRMGLNSGEVVVGAIGDDLRMDYTAQGHTVGLAQRVEQLAAPGTVRIAAPTAALVADYFVLEDLGEFELKGLREPMHVHDLVRARPERSRIDVVLAKSATGLVGRHAEVAVLEHALDEALAGQGQVLGVVGEAGVGKTRLCLELGRLARERGAILAQAHCPAHAASVVWLPLLDLFRSLFDIDVGDPPGAARRKIRRALSTLGVAFAAELPFVFDVLEVPDPKRPLDLGGETRRARMATLLRRVVQAQSAAVPLVLFVDDVQCADPETDLLLGEVVDALGWTRTLMVVNFRPGHRSAWMDATHYRELSLSPLPEGDVDALLTGLVGDDPTTSGLRRVVRERTGGNPFFVEEVVQSLVEHGVLARNGAGAEAHAPLRLVQPLGELAIPPTVSALLAARLDRLGARDKLVIRAASVIGRTFAPPVLRHVLADPAPETQADAVSGDDVDAALASLQAAEFIRREDPGRDGECAFKHPLTQAVAYGSQLADARARLHLAVARALLDLFADRIGQIAELLGHHYASAGWKFEADRWRRRARLRVTNIERSSRGEAHARDLNRRGR